jgi:hypothetical protein
VGGRARENKDGQIREIGKDLLCWMPSMLRRKAWMRQPMKRLRKVWTEMQRKERASLQCFGV